MRLGLLEDTEDADYKYIFLTQQNIGFWDTEINLKSSQSTPLAEFIRIFDTELRRCNVIIPEELL